MTVPLRSSIFPSLAALALLLLACGPNGTIAPASSAAAPTDTTTADSLLFRAKTFIDEGADRGSLDSLKQARALATQATGDSARRALAHYYAALADYRIANQFYQDNEDHRESLIKDAVGHLKRATEVDAAMADAWALLAGCYGQLMGMNPMQSMSLGPKSEKAMTKAKELAPANPRVWIIDGTSDFYTPSMFGGDKERALEKFKKATRLAEEASKNDPLAPSWGHADAHAWVGIAQLDAERYDDARSAFETALEINPDYGWVKHVLLPQLEKESE